jgi:hypothetical protein
MRAATTDCGTSGAICLAWMKRGSAEDGLDMGGGGCYQSWREGGVEGGCFEGGRGSGGEGGPRAVACCLCGSAVVRARRWHAHVCVSDVCVHCAAAALAPNPAADDHRRSSTESCGCCCCRRRRYCMHAMTTTTMMPMMMMRRQCTPRPTAEGVLLLGALRLFLNRKSALHALECNWHPKFPKCPCCLESNRIRVQLINESLQ